MSKNPHNAAATVARMLEHLVPRLAAHQFKKRAGLIFTIELSNGCLGWLGLNRATKHHGPGVMEVNPVIGVRHQEVERIVAELRGERPHAYVPPTMSTPLGYRMPERRYRAWMFSTEITEPAAIEMVEAIASYGLPFMHASSSLEKISEALQPRSKLAIEDMAIYPRPVVSMLLGDPGRASSEIDAELAAQQARTDAAAVEYRRFASALRARLPGAL